MAGLSYEGRTVFCSDVAASARYYEEALGFHRAFESGGDIAMTIPVADTQPAHVTFYLHHAAAPNPVDLGSFRVADVEAFLERYRAAGYTVVAEAADTSWGTREAVVNDLDGNGLLVTAQLHPTGR